MMPISITRAAPILFFKALKIANQPGYYLHGGHWHAIEVAKPIPKGAAQAQHPKAAGHFQPMAHFTDDQWAALKLPNSNTNAGSFNAALDKLKGMSDSGDVTGMLGMGVGTNTYGGKLAKIANHLLGKHGSEHQVVPGQKAGTHAAVQSKEPPAAHPTGLPSHIAPIAEPDSNGMDAKDYQHKVGTEWQSAGGKRMVVGVTKMENGFIRLQVASDGSGELELVNPNDLAKLITSDEASTAKPAPATPAPLDHGVLNIPGKTNSINAELDKHKAQQAKEAKADAKVVTATKKTAKAEAKALFAEHGDAMIAKYGTKFGSKELAAHLDDLVKWQPAKFIALTNKFLAETSASAQVVDVTPAGFGPDADAGPQEGDTKAGANGVTLTLKDGHWVAPEAAPVAASASPYKVIPSSELSGFQGQIYPVKSSAAEVESLLGLPPGGLYADDTSYSDSFEFEGPDGKRFSVYANGSEVRVRPRMKNGDDIQVLEAAAEKFVSFIDGGKVSPSTSAKVSVSGLAMPEFIEGKGTSSVKSHYEKIAQKVIQQAEAGNLEVLKYMPDTVGNTWKGKTPNSKKLVALHAAAIASLQADAPPIQAAPVATLPAGWKGSVNGMASNPDPITGGIVDKNDKFGWFAIPNDNGIAGQTKDKFFTSQADAFSALSDAQSGKTAEPLQPAIGNTDTSASSVQLSNALASLKLPDTNSNAKAVNKQVDKLMAAVASGDAAQVEALKFGTNTYGKKLNAAKEKVLDAMKNGTIPAAVAPPVPVAVPAAPAAPAVPASPLVMPLKPKLKDFNFSQVANIWEKMAADGKEAELVATVEKFAQSAMDNAAIAGMPGSYALAQYGKALMTAMQNTGSVPAVVPAAVAPAVPVTPTPSAKKSSSPAPVGTKATFGKDEYEKVADKTWFCAGSAHSASLSSDTSAALELIAGHRPSTPWMDYNNTPLDRQFMVELVAIKGGSAETALGILFPSGVKDGPQEGELKIINGVTYILQNGRWHKQGEEPSKAEKVAKVVPPKGLFTLVSDAEESVLDGDFESTELAVHNAASAWFADNPDPAKFKTALNDSGYSNLYDGVINGIAPVSKKASPFDSLAIPDFHGDKGTAFYNPKWAANYNTVAESLLAKVKENGANAFKGGVLVSHANGTYSIKIGGFHLQGVSAVSGKARSTAMHKFVTELKALAGKPSKKPKAKTNASAPAKPSAPKSKATGDAPIESIDAWTKTGGQGGYNPGGTYRDASGQEWYCKFPDAGDAVVKNELLAMKLYAAAGCDVPDVKLVTQGGKLGTASKIIAGIAEDKEKLKSGQAHSILSGFAADAWLANWDCVGNNPASGKGFDNIQFTPDGKAYRIDAGGALSFKGTGASKPASEFTNEVVEISTLRDPSVNKNTAAAFVNLTDADVAASVAKVLAISDYKIAALVDEFGPDDKAGKQALTSKLVARKNYLASKYPHAVAKTEKTSSKPPKAKPDPTALVVDASLLPKTHDFMNWQNTGKPISEKPYVQQNIIDEQAILDFALKGDLIALKEYKFQPVDKITGMPEGPMRPILSHSSQYVKAFYDDCVSFLEVVANPPEPMRAFNSVEVSTVEALADHFKPFDYGKSVETVPANQRLGFWIALGSALTPNKLVPAAPNMNFPQAVIDKAKALFAAFPKTVKTFLSSVQSSGSANQPYRDGKEFDSQGQKCREVLSDCYANATEHSPGTQIHKWMKMPDSMVEQFLSNPEGLVFQNPGSMCCSRSATATKHKGFGDHLISITFAKGAKGMDTFGSGGFESEQEITSLPGSRFMVTKREMVVDNTNNKGLRLQLDVVMLPPDPTYIANLGGISTI